MVWPRPASPAEAERLRDEERKAEIKQLAEAEGNETVAHWARTTRRQAKAAVLLNAPPPLMTNAPAYHGRALTEVLHSTTPSRTNHFTLAELLTLNQVITGLEPETVTFELPINYDALTNLGVLQLYIDPAPEDDSDEGCNVGSLECNRSTNGNCLLVWSTLYESPGQHALQTGLVLNGPARADEEIIGPLAAFVVTNLCQFSLSSAHFEREYGVTLHARLPEPNGAYTIELKSVAGETLRTITGTTSNRVIKVHWDLQDNAGNVCTNEAFDTVFHITLPDSGRSQTLRGP